MREMISRREFLERGAKAFGAIFLAACAPQIAVADPEAPTEKPKEPTAEATPTKKFIPEATKTVLPTETAKVEPSPIPKVETGGASIFVGLDMAKGSRAVNGGELEAANPGVKIVKSDGGTYEVPSVQFVKKSEDETSLTHIGSMVDAKYLEESVLKMETDKNGVTARILEDGSRITKQEEMIYKKVDSKGNESYFLNLSQSGVLAVYEREGILYQGLVDPQTNEIEKGSERPMFSSLAEIAQAENFVPEAKEHEIRAMRMEKSDANKLTGRLALRLDDLRVVKQKYLGEMKSEVVEPETVTFDLVGGGEHTMIKIEPEEIVEVVLDNTYTYNSASSTPYKFSDSDQRVWDFFKPLSKIPGYAVTFNERIIYPTPEGNEYFAVYAYKVDGGSIIVFRDKSDQNILKGYFVPEDSKNIVKRFGDQTPTLMK